MTELATTIFRGILKGSMILVCLCFLYLPMSAAAVDTFNLDSLLAVSVGGEAAVAKLRTITSAEASGTIMLNGQPGKVVMYSAYPDKLYIRIDLGEYALVQAYDGATAWQQDHNGSVSILSGYERQELVNQVYMQSYSWLFDDRLSGGTEYVGLFERDGVLYHQVAFYPFNRDTLEAWFEVETGLLRYAISDLDNLRTVTYSDDYRSVDGVMVSFYSQSSAIGAPLEVNVTLAEMTFQAPFDHSIFSPPQTRARDFRFPAGTDSVIVPFEYLAGHIFVPVTINGKKRLRMILDSGASANVFHAPNLSGLDLPKVGTQAAKGISGWTEVQMVRTDSLAVGDLLLFDQVAGSLELEGLGNALPERDTFGGVLGYDFLSRFPILVDYDCERLIVYNPDTFTAAEGGAEVGFHLTMQIPTIEAELVGISGQFIVDLGNSFGLIIHDNFYRVNNLDDRLSDIREFSGALSGVGGRVVNKSAFAATFAFGDIRISSLRVLIPETTGGLSGSTELAGNIGNMLLKQFRILFDYGNQRLIFYDPTERD